MTQNTYIADRFEYHLEDLDCQVCLHYKRKSKKYINGCHEQICRFTDIRYEAIKSGRLKRRRDHFNMKHHQSTQEEVLDHE